MKESTIWALGACGAVANVFIDIARSDWNGIVAFCVMTFLFIRCWAYAKGDEAQ